MDIKNLINKIITTVPPWGLIGAALILMPMLAFVTYEDINRQKAASRRQLLAKGAALIRSFEAGTRAGMMMRQWENRHLQRLLMETARQPDITYLMVTDSSGRIRAHSNPERIDQLHGNNLDLNLIAETPTEIYRIINKRPDAGRVFEVYRKFSPAKRPMGIRGRHHNMMRPFQENNRGGSSSRPRQFGHHMGPFGENAPENLIIFVGLDMTEIEKTLAADTRHSLFMAAILLLVGFAGVTLLFMTHTYRVTRASLKRIESFSDNLVDNLPVGLISIGADHRIATVNPEAGRILRLDNDQLVGHAIDTALPDQLKFIVRDLDASDGAVETELVCHMGEAVSIPIGLNASAWYDREGTLMGTILLIRDLSEIRALRKEIARSQRLASLGSLAAGVAHEIRNPLSSIKGFATYFKERDGDNHKDRETADIMISEVDRLNRVVGQLLELARPVELILKPISLGTYFNNSIALIESRATEKSIRINKDISNPNLTILADPDRLNQVLLNLYLNAIDALEPDRGTLTVSARKSGREPGVLIAITDNGGGIQKEDLPHVFDPYFTSKSTGTGLGLAIVHNIMEAHAGSVSVDSTPGVETTFTLFFPEKAKGKINE
ncbi:MAG: PAS domain-containing protein [Desulfobacterales bacterium]|nr:PAS domain-containing protein [Desulfobacterales bacterium]